MINGAIGPTISYVAACSASANFAIDANPFLPRDYPAQAVGAVIDQCTASTKEPLTAAQDVDEIGAALAGSGIKSTGITLS